MNTKVTEITQEQGKRKDPSPIPRNLRVIGYRRVQSGTSFPLLLVLRKKKISTLMNETNIASYDFGNIDGEPVYIRKKMALMKITREKVLF